jgi:hypothetical protein
MNKRTLEALNGSIKKWEMIVEGTEVDKGWFNCSLCKVFCRNAWEVPEGELCKGCPVSEKTGVPFCEDTPYQDIDDYKGNVGDEGYKEIAQREVNFLKSLLPKNVEK